MIDEELICDWVDKLCDAIREASSSNDERNDCDNGERATVADAIFEAMRSLQRFDHYAETLGLGVIKAAEDHIAPALRDVAGAIELLASAVTQNR